MPRRVFAIVFLMALTLLAACNRTATTGGPPATHPTGPSDEEGGDGEVKAASELEIKDCINLDEVDNANEAEVVDCEDPHDGQVVSEIEFSEQFTEFDAKEGAPYPSEIEILANTELDCDESLDFYSEENGDLTLDFVLILPDEDQWDEGDRKVACVIVLESGERELEGDLEGLS